MPSLKEAGQGGNFSRTAFQRFEDIIDATVKAFPQPISITIPSGNQSSTYASRIREAARGYNTHNYISRIDREKFKACWEKVAITYGPNNTLLLGDKALVAGGKATDYGRINSPNGDLVFECRNLQELCAFLLLCNNGCFRGQPFKLINFDAACRHYIITKGYQDAFPDTFIDLLGPNELVIT